jgi:hypothetical protein
LYKPLREQPVCLVVILDAVIYRDDECPFAVDHEPTVPEGGDPVVPFLLVTAESD